MAKRKPKMAKRKLKKIIKKPLPKIETEKINPVRKKDSHWKMRKIKLLKPLSSELSNVVKKTKIRVLGIGGGGGSIVSEIAARIKKASFVVANTDLQALKEVSRKAIKFHFGGDLTQGLGTGMNTELGREAAQKEKEKIKKLLEGQDLCILVVSLGGGTGSGAAPVFAKVAKDLGLISYGIFTLPFKFEGEKKMEIAKASLEKLKPNLNAISILPNERIFQLIDKQTSLKTALSAINKNLAESLEGLIETIYQPGLINIDFADLKTILEGQGKLAYLNTVEVSGSDRGAEAIKAVISNPLYPYGIDGARGILFNIAGEKNLGLNEVSQISKTISELVNKEAKIIFGLSQSKKYQNKIKITLLATNCPSRIFQGEPKKRQLKKKSVSKKPPTGAEVSPPTPAKAPKQPRLKLKPQSKQSPKKQSGFKKVKVDISGGVKKQEIPSLGAEAKTNLSSISSEEKIRKNGLQLKKEIEAEEAEILKKEKEWESPALLRKKLAKIE